MVGVALLVLILLACRFLFGRFPMLCSVVKWPLVKLKAMRTLPILAVLALIMLLSATKADAGVSTLIANTVLKVAGVVSGRALDVFDGVFPAILAAFGELICVIVDYVGPLAVDLVESIPDEASGYISNAGTAFNIVNAWIPLVEAFAMFALYLTFLTIQIPLKLFIKLVIPTVG